MCGIGGILRVWPADQRELALRTPHAGSIPEEWLNILDDSIRHRGPDGQGRFRDRALRADGCVVDVAFVHRRLSIIDHAGGSQPMVWLGTPPLRGGQLLSSDELARHNARILNTDWTDLRPDAHAPASERRGTRIAVVFNGCIYNHRELRAELQHAGHVFTSDHSDTEVLVHGWREWKEGLPQRLDGMFAFVVWESATARLFCARDHYGEKPLHTTAAPDSGAPIREFAFASTSSALSRFGAIRGETVVLNRASLIPSVRLGFPQGDLLAGQRSVGPSCCLSVHMPAPFVFEGDNRPTMTDCTEWSYAPSAYDGYVSSGAATRMNFPTVDDIDTALGDAVSRQLDADVDIGVLLSGGVDSSLVALLAGRSRPIDTFTVRMPHPGFDESPYAAMVASAVGSRHHTLECAGNPCDDLAGLITRIGMPLGDSSLLPTAWVARAARNSVRVVLTGDGGDEMFAGYDRYRAMRLLRSAGFWVSLVPPILDGAARTLGSERAYRLLSAARLWRNQYLELLAVFNARELAELLGTQRQPSSQQQWEGLIAGPHASFGPTLRRTFDNGPDDDINNYLPNDLLMKVDSATMSVALEARAPFLASTIGKVARTASLESLMPRGRQGGRKGLLRAVARKYLPAEIVDRPKMGFAIPVGEWFRTDYGGLRTMLLDHINSTEPFGPPLLGIDLNMKFIRQMLDEHLGTGMSGRIKRDHSQRLYMLLVLSIWAKWMGAITRPQGA